LIFSKLGQPLWFFKPHHINENGPDFDGILKDSLKRVIAEVSNLRRGSYINLTRAQSMEKSAGPADYKLHIISFESCYEPAAKGYLEQHGWIIISLRYQVMTEDYYIFMIDRGYPIALDGYESNFIIEALFEGVKQILLSPIYGSTTANYHKPPCQASKPLAVLLLDVLLPLDPLFTFRLISFSPMLPDNSLDPWRHFT
jgi:hypothetical protein